MTRLKKRISSGALVLSMLATMLPMSVFAANDNTAEEDAPGQYTIADDTKPKKQLATNEVTLLENEIEPEPAAIGAVTRDAAVVGQGSCGSSLSWTEYSDGKLVISGYGYMENYDSYNGLNPPWSDNINEVEISTGVKNIGSYAFAYSEYLENVTIPDSVISIGDSAFRACTNLKSITIPDGVSHMGDSAFISCKSLTSIIIPDKVSFINDGTFEFCENLTSITIPDGVTGIGVSAFGGCTNLKNIVLPDGIDYIGYAAFLGCKSLTHIKIPEGVTNIQISTFGACTKLKSVAFPKSLTTIGPIAFYSCNSLTDIYYNGSEEDWAAINIDYSSQGLSSNDCLRNATMHYNSTGPDGICGDDLAWHIDEYGVLTISGSAQMYDYDASSNLPPWNHYKGSITGIVLEEGVSSVGDYAFSGCDKLKRVIIPDSMTSIGDYAFSACNSLADVYFCGSETDWAAISIGSDNGPMYNATIHFNCCGDLSSDCYSAFVAGLPKLDLDNARVFLDFINDPRNPNPIEGADKTKIYKLITGDLSDYDSENILQLKADLLTMTAFLKAQNASKINKTYTASQQAADAMTDLAMTFVPEDGKISDADLGIVSGYQNKVQDYVEKGTRDLINEIFFYGTYGGSVDKAISQIDDAMSYFNSVQSGINKGQEILNGIMTAVYGLKYSAASELHFMYHYFNEYVLLRPRYEINDPAFQLMMEAHKFAYSQNNSDVINYSLQLFLKAIGVPDVLELLPHLEHWAEYICEVEQYVNDFNSHADEYSHDWLSYIRTHTDENGKTETITDFICTTCGAKKREAEENHTHSYSSNWKYDGNNHWHECACGEKADIAGHTPGAAATETTPQTCTECGYIIAPATGHVHSYGSEWKHDENSHWHECACGEKADVAGHTLSNWMIDPIATSTQNGYRHRECTICTYILERDIIPITGGNSGNETGNTDSGNNEVPSGNNKIEITSNPDGTITKTESKADGTIVETTERLDSSTIIIEKKPDGTKVEILTHADGSRIETIIQPNGFSQIIMDRSDGSSSTTVSEGGQMSTQVIISEPVASEGILKGESVVLPMPKVYSDRNWEIATTITIGIPIDVAIKAEIPVENMSPSVVAVISKSDGTEEIIKTSIFTKDGIVVTLKNGDRIKIVDNSKSFSDVPLTHWGIEGINFVSSREIFVGTSDTSFTPEGIMNRGMIATVLYRLKNTPVLTGGTAFSDVEADEWYTEAIQWAAENDIMNGYGNNRFGPMDSVTREQLAVILYNYTASEGISVDVIGDLSVFDDAEETSDWAKEAISWAVGVGLLSGKGNGILDPTATATRAEVAQMLMNYFTNVV